MKTPRINLPDHLDQIDWLSNWLTNHTEGPSCAPQKGLGEGEGAVDCAARLILERDDEIARLREIIDTLDRQGHDLYRMAAAGRVFAPNPVINCPCCGAPEIDYDGFGVLACPRDPVICYCSHPSITDAICGICNDTGPRVEETRSPPDPWKTGKDTPPRLG